MNRPQVAMQEDLGERFGLSRAIRAGNLIFVSGTTASGPNGTAFHPGDAYEQTKLVLGRIEAALKQLGANLEHVVETRTYITDMALCHVAGRAHGEVFRDVRPASATVQIGPLLHPDLMVEITAIASLD